MGVKIKEKLFPWIVLNFQNFSNLDFNESLAMVDSVSRANAMTLESIV